LVEISSFHWVLTSRLQRLTLKHKAACTFDCGKVT
jgi:hypothetical protein